MDRLLFTGMKSDEQNYAIYQSDPDWQQLYTLLRHGYWHVTTPAGWKGIREAGAIKPNADKSKARFGCAEKSYCLVHNCIALFDFGTPTEREVIESWEHARDVIVSDTSIHVLLQLDKPRLQSEIIPNREAWRREDRKVFACVPFSEVWYPRDIPLAAISAAYRVPPTHRFDFDLVPISLDAQADD
jgi:hypothetical protein